MVNQFKVSEKEGTVVRRGKFRITEPLTDWVNRDAKTINLLSKLGLLSPAPSEYSLSLFPQHNMF